MSSASAPGTSIDQYKEKNYDSSAPLSEKIKTLFDFVDSHKVGMMTTRRKEDGMLVSRAMAIASRENEVDLIYHTNVETGKAHEIESDPHVSVSFYKDTTGEWVSISGHAEIVTDRAVVKKYYSPGLKAWIGDQGDGVHDGGPMDPRIGIIKVKTHTATYAVQTATTIGKFYGIAKGIVTGQVPSINSIVECKDSRPFTHN